MDNDSNNFVIDPWQHIHNLFKDVNDDIGSPVTVSRLVDRFAPALFDSPSIVTLTSDRNIGYLAFYQSLSSYTIHHYNTLSTAFLEHILVQTASLLPITKIATCLRLGDSQYDSSYESDDRLLMLLGVLVSFYGSSAVDSFMHPLFEKHIFNEIQFPQPDEGQAIAQFESLIRSRGAMDVYYQQLETACPQTQCRWECTITYKLGPTTILLLHSRTGKNKKQAKLRTLHDIHNYYACGSIEFFLPGNAWHPDHPHCRPHINTRKLNVITLPIPTENMYDYDDDKYENTPLVRQLEKNLAKPNYVHISIDAYDENEPEKYVAYLSQVLLEDSNNDPAPSNNSYVFPQVSPLPDVPQQQSPSSVSSAVLSPSSSPLPAKNDRVSSSQLGSGPTSSIARSPIMTNDQHTVISRVSGKPETVDESQQKLRMNNISASSSNNNNNNNNNSNHASDNPGKQLQLQSLAPLLSAPVEKAPGALLPTEEHLIDKATKLMDLFTVRERCRLDDYKENLLRNPNDAKGCLMNLARKIDDGYYRSVAEHVQLSKSGTRAHYIVTVRFGVPNIEVLLARGHTKKSTAESLAALAIFSLLEKVSKSINAEMKLPFLEPFRV